MRLGIDLGTTRTVVAYADRGNYPVVSFDDDDGDASEHFPSVVAEVDGKLVYGFDAVAAARNGAPLVRSFKRALAAPDVNGATPVVIGAVTAPLLDVMTGFVGALVDQLATRSNLPLARTRPNKKSKSDLPRAAISAVVAVPAHAHAAQRFLTLEAFKRAGVFVIALLNEPSAAGFEYTHRLARTVSSRRTRVVVYDLGGGTFDASLVRVDGEHHDVVATAGDNRLGGDDFDEALARCACQAAFLDFDALEPSDRATLLQSCRVAKETLGPNKRKIAIDAPFAASVTVDDFYAAATPLVERSIKVMAPLLNRMDADAASDVVATGADPATVGARRGATQLDAEADDDLRGIAGIYLVGGGSGLPLVARMLKERFGRRVHRSAYPGASTAIGLAIASDDESGYSLTDQFSRSFGVFRERDGGRRLSFDSLVKNEAVVPKSDRVVMATRRYRAAHNVGWFRFVECPSVDDAGEPCGDLMPFGEVVFPFDAALRADGLRDLRDVPVERRAGGPVIEERYMLNASGLVEVEIADVDAGYVRTFRLGAP